MKTVDAHADTLCKWTDKETRTDIRISDIPNTHLQVFAAFAEDSEQPWERLNALINTFDQDIPFQKVRKKKDLDRRDAAPKAMLSVEGASFLAKDIGRLETLYERGVRMMSLTWNRANALACGCQGPDTGLTALGKDVVRRMGALGMIVDVSHLGEKSFYDVLRVCQKPPVASHSSVYALCRNERNLKDEQLRALFACGGVVGINFYPLFLTEEPETATGDDVLRHIDYVLRCGGEKNVGLGSDFDGVPFLPKGVEGCSFFSYLADTLTHCMGKTLAENSMGGNFLNLFRENLP